MTEFKCEECGKMIPDSEMVGTVCIHCRFKKREKTKVSFDNKDTKTTG